MASPNDHALWSIKKVEIHNYRPVEGFQDSQCCSSGHFVGANRLWFCSASGQSFSGTWARVMVPVFGQVPPYQPPFLDPTFSSVDMQYARMMKIIFLVSNSIHSLLE